MITICKRFHFDAAHYLENHDGKCKDLHGHRFSLEIEITGEKLLCGSSKGMIMDFEDLKKIIQRKLLSKIDHTCLNYFEGASDSYCADMGRTPTAENIVEWIVSVLRKPLSLRNVDLLRVRLYENPDSWAEWRSNE
jgi:6-pyruvoyltetrahydropterin/6-carboxytetrahydropterin synthase